MRKRPGPFFDGATTRLEPVIEHTTRVHCSKLFKSANQYMLGYKDPRDAWMVDIKMPITNGSAGRFFGLLTHW